MRRSPLAAPIVVHLSSRCSYCESFCDGCWWHYCVVPNLCPPLSLSGPLDLWTSGPLESPNIPLSNIRFILFYYFLSNCYGISPIRHSPTVSIGSPVSFNLLPTGPLLVTVAYVAGFIFRVMRMRRPDWSQDGYTTKLSHQPFWPINCSYVPVLFSIFAPQQIWGSGIEPIFLVLFYFYFLFYIYFFPSTQAFRHPHFFFWPVHTSSAGAGL